jgi:hypothetical protein
MVLANIIWHCGLLIAVRQTDSLIEFSNWYFQLAVFLPPVSTFAACGVMYAVHKKNLASLMAIETLSLCLACFHWWFIEAAAAMI